MNKLGISYRKVAEFLPYAMNARVHSEEQLQDIARSIGEFGFVNPILIGSDGVIIAGHGRVMAAEMAGLATVPCVVLGHLSEKQRRALALADNRIALKSQWDFEKLSAELSTLAELDYDLSLTGFTDDELGNFLQLDEGLLPEFQISQERTAQQQDEEDQEEEEGAPEPKASDDDYSKFELIMLHENKLKLVEKLNGLRKKRGYAKLEDALMEIIEEFDDESV